MVIWGGLNHGLVYFGDGGRYNPVDNRWHPVSALGSPDPRAQHTAVWTGEEMIVWGGQGTGFSTFADGGRYNPELDRWVTIAPERSPMARSSHTAVWTGSEMIVAGGSSVSGEGTAKRGDYAIYNPRLPHLTITREVTGSAKVEWPFPSSAFQLQETREVAAPRWNDVEVMPLREETNWSITVPSTNSSFFRLRQR